MVNIASNVSGDLRRRGGRRRGRGLRRGMRRARPAPAPAAPAHESIRIGGVVGDQETAPAARGRRYHGRGPRFTPKARALSMAVGLGGKLEHVPDLITGWCEHPNVMSTGRSTCTGTGVGNVEANFSHGPFSTHTINGGAAVCTCSCSLRKRGVDGNQFLSPLHVLQM